MQRIFQAYEDLKDERNLIDFEDVLLLTIAMLEEDEKLAATVRNQYRHFVVDEYQDVSPLQQRLLDVWLGGRDDICVVGDASQTIYSFTGATSRYLLDFARRYRGAHGEADPRLPFPFAGGGVGEPSVGGAPSASGFEPAFVGAAAGADVSARPRRGCGVVRLRG